MSQWDFCDGICSVQTLSNIENGKQAISPIVFQSLTEKCGEMINPYPQFVSLDDFQCYMAVSNVDFYIDSWQFSIALDELRKIEESYFAENKLYYVDAILVGTKMYGKDMICKRKQFGSFILHVPETKFYIGNRSVKEIEPDYLVDNICEYNAEEILDLCYRLDHREEQK